MNMSDIGSDVLLAVSPPQSDAFVERMSKHWTETLGNALSEPLKALWGLMATTFSEVVNAPHEPSVSPKWQVLGPPTGSGKTEGLKVYASMIAQQNRDPWSETQPIGVLIVTRLTEDADKIAEGINELSGLSDAARASHHKSSLRDTERTRADVLVVTHSAYSKALDQATTQADQRLQSLLQWEGGVRQLTVIDEALTNLIEVSRVTSEEVGRAALFLEQNCSGEFESPLAAVRQFKQLFAIFAEHSESDSEDENCLLRLPSATSDFPESLSMGPLRAALSGMNVSVLTGGRVDSLQAEQIRSGISSTLAGIETLLRNHTYLAREGNDLVLYSGRLLIPDGLLHAPVVLDATASTQFLWGLLQDRVVIRPVPEGSRSYSKVTLYVGRVPSLGKSSMTAEGKTRIPKVLQAVANKSDPTSRVLLCCHKDAEHHAEGVELDFAEFRTAHFGAIDGKNDWQDFDTCVIAGMPYWPPNWAINALITAKGGLGAAEDLTRTLAEVTINPLAVSVIQAVNRIRCRRVIDANGNCPPCSVFLLLRDQIEGDQILDLVKQEMPGIKVKDWDFSFDGPAAKIRRGSHHAALLTYMKNREPGVYPMKEMEGELGIDSRQMGRVKAVLRQPDHPLTLALGDIGVTYEGGGRGRRAGARLRKS